MTAPHVARTTYGPDIDNVSRARAWAVGELRDRVPADDRLLADVELVLSELITNAIKAGTTRVTVELRADRHSVRVRVQDDAGGRLTVRAASPTTPGGRGLPIVAALSSDWGVDETAPGKRVWATLATTAV